MTTTSCSGLPVCLSGVQILPQARPPYRRVHSLVGGIKERSHGYGGQGFSHAPNLALGFHASISVGNPLTQLPTTDERDVDCTLAVIKTANSKTEKLHAERPRFTVAEEMLDLDRRREAIKKQRCLRNAGNHMEEYRLIRDQNEFILASYENHQSRLHCQSDCMHKSICAKAA